MANPKFSDMMKNATPEQRAAWVRKGKKTREENKRQAAAYVAELEQEVSDLKEKVAALQTLMKK